jgi:hypothetical protein
MAKFEVTREWLERAMQQTERADKVTFSGDTARALLEVAWEAMCLAEDGDVEDEVSRVVILRRPPPATRH